MSPSNRPRFLATAALCSALRPAPGDGQRSGPRSGTRGSGLTAVGPPSSPAVRSRLTGRGSQSRRWRAVATSAGSIKAKRRHHPFDVRLRAERRSETEARVQAGGELFAALGTFAGQIDAQAILSVDSAIDPTTHTPEPLRVSLEVARILAPRLDRLELPGAATAPLKDRVHSNDWVVVQGDNLMLGPGEGQSTAVIDGRFLPDGVSGNCLLWNPVNGLEIVVVSRSAPRPSSRRVPVVAADCRHPPGRFVGTVSLKNPAAAGHRCDAI